MPFLLCAVLLAGCARRPPPKPDPAKEKAPPAPVSARMENPTVSVADPGGQWVFSARSRTMTLALPAAEEQAGPYTMAGATGTYRAGRRSPVHLQADRIVVDRGARRLTLIGRVKVRNDVLTVEGDRVIYDLRTGEVRAAGRTKWTFKEVK